MSEVRYAIRQLISSVALARWTIDSCRGRSAMRTFLRRRQPYLKL
jgi:hypothetical protein